MSTPLVLAGVRNQTHSCGQRRPEAVRVTGGPAPLPLYLPSQCVPCSHGRELTVSLGLPPPLPVLVLCSGG